MFYAIFYHKNVNEELLPFLATLRMREPILTSSILKADFILKNFSSANKYGLCKKGVGGQNVSWPAPSGDTLSIFF